MTSAFRRPAGEITGYLGPNGSGKSTTMKMIAGLIETGLGRNPFRRRAHSPRSHRPQAAHGLRAGRAASVCPSERPGIPDHGGPTARLAREAHGGTHRRPASPSRRSIPTATRPFRPIRKACARRSCWPGRCCTIPICCCSTSRFPAWTFPPRWFCAAWCRNWRRRGKVILFSSHELETVERVSSRVVILHRGKVVADDSIEHLRVLRSAANAGRCFLAARRGAGHGGGFARDRGPDSRMRREP